MIIVRLIIGSNVHNLLFYASKERIRKGWNSVSDSFKNTVSIYKPRASYLKVYRRNWLPCGHWIQSLVRRTPEPWHGRPPLLGGGLVQVLVLILPAARVAPGHLHSDQADQGDQPPLTESKKNVQLVRIY